MKETFIVGAIVQYLDHVPGAFVWRQNVGGMTKKYVNKAGKEKVHHIKFGYEGIADIIGLYKGRFLAIECKMLGKKQTLSQLTFQADIENHGGLYILANSVDDVIEGLK